MCALVVAVARPTLRFLGLLGGRGHVLLRSRSASLRGRPANPTAALSAASAIILAADLCAAEPAADDRVVLRPYTKTH